MPSYKLHYFPLRARGEVIRYVFAASGVPYEDIRHTFEEWPKVKPGALFGQLPQLEVDGKKIVQSNTIARYLAKEFGLAGKTKWEETECDMYAATVEDLFSKTARIFFEKDAKVKAELLKDYVEGGGLGLIKGFDVILSKNPSGYLVGNALTYADLALLGGIDFFENTLKEDAKAVIAKCPNVLKHRQKIAALPKIAAFISTRPYSDK